MLTTPQHWTRWAEVDLGAITHNVREVLRLLKPGTKLIAVAKANAYGTGAGEVVPVLQRAGAASVAVSTYEEAIELRDAGIGGELLVFTPCPPDLLGEMNAAQITVTAASEDDLEALVAKPAEQRPRFHVKLDTGMGRLGFAAPEWPRAVTQLVNADCRTDGIYSHFADARNPNDRFGAEQARRFTSLLQDARNAGLSWQTAHLCNSAGTLRHPECHFDAVRVGTLLYGDYPHPTLRGAADLRRVLRFKSRLVAVRMLCAGNAVGYGREWVARRDTRVGVVPTGWVDGVTLTPSARTETVAGTLQRTAREIGVAFGRVASLRHVLCHEIECPVVGRVGMQLMSVDLTACPQAKVGDEVEIPVMKTMLNSRVPRVYIAADELATSN